MTPAKRPRHRMPAAVRRALEARNLLEASQQRPPYQRNDFLGWIAKAARPETKAKRLAQMLDELERGGVSMGMRWSGR